MEGNPGTVWPGRGRGGARRVIEPLHAGRQCDPIINAQSHFGFARDGKIEVPHHESVRINLRFIDWIWRIRGRVPLPDGQSIDEAFDRLDPLFQQTGTRHERTDDTLTFRKKDPAAQDKMSIYDEGVLQIRQGVGGLILHYHLNSRALLFCFLAPLLFLGVAQLTIALGNLEKPSTDAAAKAKKEAKKNRILPQNPIDKALGAPAPEKPKKKGTDKSKEDEDKPSPTSAYVFAGLFATLYIVGRVLEDWLVKALFRKRLMG
jgi:hypothetical protein